MERIHYAGDSVVTGSDIAHALLEYARALARGSSAATVGIPVVGPDGDQTRWEVLIGPASQITATSVEWDGPELVDETLVARLRRGAAAVEADAATVQSAASSEDPEAAAAGADWSDYEGL